MDYDALNRLVWFDLAVMIDSSTERLLRSLGPNFSTRQVVLIVGNLNPLALAKDAIIERLVRPSSDRYWWLHT